MRMWMLDPKWMCRKHLLGEHVEMNMFAGSMLKGVSMKGYIDSGLMYVPKLNERHDVLVAEMLARGYNHKSPMQDVKHLLFDHPDLIDLDWNVQDLAQRCPECAERLLDAGIVSSGILISSTGP